MFTDIFTVQGKGKGSIPVLAACMRRKIKVADNAVSTEQAARVTGQMQGPEGCNDQHSAFMPKAKGAIPARW